MDSRERVEKLVKSLLASGLDEKQIIQIINNIIINFGAKVGTKKKKKQETEQERITREELEETGAKLNYRVSPDVKNAFIDYCNSLGVSSNKRGKVLENILSDFLKSKGFL